MDTFLFTFYANWNLMNTKTNFLAFPSKHKHQTFSLAAKSSFFEILYIACPT